MTLETKTILLCDSRAPWWRKVARAASAAGARVLRAGDGSEALEILAEQPVDLLIGEEEVARYPLMHVVAAARLCGVSVPVVVVVAGEPSPAMRALARLAGGIEPAPAGAAVAHALSILRGAAPTPRILVADDDGGMRDFLADAFTDAGFDVLEAEDGDEAVALAQHFEHARPGGTGIDLVVSDMWMPKRDGLEVLAGVHAIRGAVPVILISAFATEDVRRAGEGAGAHAVVAKPFDLARLCALARDAAGLAA